MAIVVTPDHPRSNERDSLDGIVAERAFTVQGLTGASDTILTQARTAPGIPSRGDAHPSLAGIICIEVSAAAVNESMAMVTCRYEQSTPASYPEGGGQFVTVDSTSASETYYFDINDTRLSATYSGILGSFTHYPSATIDEALVTVTYRRYEQTSEAAIAQLALDYVERVNDLQWAGWAEKTWKVDDIQSRPHGERNQWREVQYVLTYNPRTWMFLSRVVRGGRVPEDSTDGNGFRRQDVRQLADFTQLPFTPVQGPLP